VRKKKSVTEEEDPNQTNAFGVIIRKFKICVYEFENEETAKVNYEILQKAVSSGDGKCNSIFNTEFILKKNEIFEFWTMDRKSLGRMREYINFVERQ